MIIITKTFNGIFFRIYDGFEIKVDKSMQSGYKALHIQNDFPEVNLKYIDRYDLIRFTRFVL